MRKKTCLFFFLMCARGSAVLSGLAKGFITCHSHSCSLVGYSAPSLPFCPPLRPVHSWPTGSPVTCRSAFLEVSLSAQHRVPSITNPLGYEPFDGLRVCK